MAMGEGWRWNCQKQPSLSSSLQTCHFFLAEVGAQSALGWAALWGRHYKAFPVQEEGSAPPTVLV